MNNLADPHDVRRVGAYGLRVAGLDDDQPLTQLTGAIDWQPVRIAREDSPTPEGSTSIDHDQAHVRLVDGDWAVMRRETRSATLLSGAPDDGRLVHPFLSAVGVVFAWWDGRHAFHGGAVAGSGGSWCVLGGRASGKSSTLARFALAGLPVLADDLVVVDRGRLLAGPRCLDLRADAAAALGLRDIATPVRGGDRLRLRLPDAPAEVQLTGLIFLAWGESLGLHPLPPRERLARLATQRCTATELSPSLLDLAELPAWELRRPASWGSLEPAVDRLLELLSG